MSVIVDVRHEIGALRLEVSFEARGRLTAIFGASGSGKTSLVNVIAGLIRPRSGLVRIGDKVLTDTANGVAVPVHRRRIGYVFQDARLFPHMSVLQNLRYGKWFTGKPERYADDRQIVSLLGIEPLLPRMPSELSGGEKQRVAIGRALLASPHLLLMDEPLASLDQARKAEILPYIERLRDEFRIPIIYVSHSVAEVARLATDIVVLAYGSTAAFGPAEEIVQRLDLVPADERDEAGAIIEMTVRSYDPAFDMTLLRASAGDAHVQGRVGEPGAKARVRIRARDVMIALDEPRNISALNIFKGEISGIADSDRSSVNVTVDCAGSAIIARITRQSLSALRLTPGTPVFAIVKAISVNRPGPSPH
jgi:molybdate transport system ATP-binding protein